MAGKKSAPPPKKKGKRRILNQRNFNVKMKKGTSQLLGAILALLIAGLLSVSFIQIDGPLGWVNRQLFSLFGWTSLLTPFIFLILSLILFGLRNALTRPHVLIGWLLFVLTISGFTKAGIIGESLWYGLESWVTAPGAGMILASGVAVAISVLFSLSIDQVQLVIIRILVKLRHILEYFLPSIEESDIPIGRATIATAMGNQPATPLKINTRSDPSPDRDPEPPTSPPPPKAPAEPGMRMASANSQPLPQPWKLPPTSLLANTKSGSVDRGNVKENAHIIEKTLESFGITAHVSEVNPGPAVTQYALQVPLGTKLSKITGLGQDLALNLAAPTGQIRIEAPIPGRSLVGIEVPNTSQEVVGLRQILESKEMKDIPSKMAIALGRDVSGGPKVLDITKMPHMLIAGATGTGKSVCINNIICSILFRATPTEVKFILVDPKRVELTQYNGIPHLLTPVIVDVEKVPSALKWAIETMKDRYKLFSEAGARNIESYNQAMGYQALPYIIILIDELADIMLMAPRQIEEYICRLAQMARATGIHLIVATQRPSVDVITGLIKANIPARVAFAVSSMVDSRVIIDGPGAEKLLGRGDMLYIPPDQAKPQRIQGTWVKDEEIQGLLNFVRNQGIAPEYTEEITSMTVNPDGSVTASSGGEDGKDNMFDEALRLIVNENKASASLIQRKLSVGYARAARILDQLEHAGMIGPADGAKPRDIRLDAVSAYMGSKAQ